MSYCQNRFLLVLLLYSLVGIFIVAGAKHNSNRLQFLTEPVSQLSRADGSRVSFRCTASPPEANIKWLRNGSIIKDNEYEWIKINGNRLILRLLKPTHGNGSDYHGAHSISSPNEVYQCLAELNNQVIVSQPAKLIIAELHPFEHHENISLTIVAGNTAVIPCNLPQGVPFVISEFVFGNTTISQSYDRTRLVPSGSLQIFNAKPSDSGVYMCVAHNPFLQERVYANHIVNLKVVKPRHISHPLRDLQFVVTPKDITNSILGQNITIECVANGHPVPKITWSKVNGELPKMRSTPDGGNLHITTLEKGDEGTYTCSASNGKATISAITTLEVAVLPNILNNDPYEMLNVVEGQDLDLVCETKGFPVPFITWLHNGYMIDSKDQSVNSFVFSNDETVLKITRASRSLHSGIFQCFATNQLGSTYSVKVVNVVSATDSSFSNSDSSQASSSVYAFNTRHRNIPERKQSRQHVDNHSENAFIELDQDIEAAISQDSVTLHNPKEHHNKKRKNSKNLKLVPPNSPLVSKLNDDSVMVRWTVSKNNGVPIAFFKVQYREAGKGANIITVDEEIPAHIFSYAVGGLIASSKYRFRIAAVYTNEDNAMSNWTRFSFPKNQSKKPTLSPTIVSAVALTQTEITLHWEFLNIDGLPIDGFFIYYRTSDSAGEYLKVTSLGPGTRMHNITHLSAGMTYEVKMRCFNPSGTSDFSNIYTVKTLPIKDSTTERPRDVEEVPGVTPGGNMFNFDQIRLIIIVIGALTFVFLVCLVICLIRCKNQTPVSKVIKKGQPLKSSTPTDYYFNSTNVYERRSNGQLASLAASTSRNSLKTPPAAAGIHNEVENEARQPLNVRLDPLNEMSSLNRKNSFRSSLSSSTHHLFHSANGNGRQLEVQQASYEVSAITASTATIDRKRIMKSCVEPYLDYPRLNHHSTSFTRLNGTLERKRRSRTDLNTLDRSYLRNISTTEIDRQPNGNTNFLPPQNGPIVIMQSSC